MPFCTPCGQVANGVLCRMISLLGKRSTPIFATGARMEHGNAFTICCVNSCVVRSDAIPNPVPVSWTAKVPRRRKKGAAGLRCGQENKRQKVAHFGRYTRFDLGGPCPCSRYSRSRWCQTSLGTVADQALAVEKDLG